MYCNDDSSKPGFSKNNISTRHLQVFLMFLGVALTYAGRFAISVAVVAMTDANSTNAGYPTYNWNSEEKAIILSSFLWSYILMQIPTGIVADVYSAHKLVCCTVFISSFINVLTPLSLYYFGWTGAVVCRILMGFTQSGLIPCCNTFISKWIPSEERSRLGPTALVGGPCGNAIALISSGWLASSTFGWPSIFYVFGVIGILWAILFYYVAADSPSEHKTISPDERDYIEKSLNKSTGSKVEPVNIPWKSMFTSLPLWSLLITNCGNMWGYHIFLTKLPAYIKYILGYDIGQSAVISALPYVATILLTFLFGWLCDLALKNRVPLSIVRKVSSTVGMWGYSILLVGLCLITTDNPWIPITILVAIYGLDAANFCGVHINHIDIAPNYAGSLAALMNATGVTVGQAAILFCGYIVTDETNADQWHIVFYISAGICFVSNLIFITFIQTQPQAWN